MEFRTVSISLMTPDGENTVNNCDEITQLFNEGFNEIERKVLGREGHEYLYVLLGKD